MGASDAQLWGVMTFTQSLRVTSKGQALGFRRDRIGVASRYSFVASLLKQV